MRRWWSWNIWSWAVLSAKAADPALLPKLPRLDIDPAAVSVGGLSAGADVAIQLQVAFSDLFSAGAAIFDGEPFHCEATHFPGEPLVPLNSTDPGSERRCSNCPPNRTVLRAHCKGKGSPPGNTRLTNVSMLVD